MRAMRMMAVLLVIFAVAVGCRTMTGKTAGQTVDDSTITGYVKAKLVADGTTNLTRIDVDTNRATVYLSGVVDTAEQRARAQDVRSTG